MRLAEGYLGKARNVTTDNYFTSLKLCDKIENLLNKLSQIAKDNGQERDSKIVLYNFIKKRSNYN